MNILGIETSCDETACAVVSDGTTILQSVVASSSKLHRQFGGIVPEIAARKQVESMIPVLTSALTDMSYTDINAIAVTVGPGLIGSLLIGVETAKTLALAWQLPIIPVNHVHAHMYANFVRHQLKEKNNLKADSKKLIAFPAISLVASGGHTELFYMKDIHHITWLGGTIDDAAGECFDKTARLLGFNNQGGPAIAVAAAKCKDRSAKIGITLPRPLLHDKTLNFSFSGLKTAVLREWKKHNNHSKELIQTFAYEIQEAITDVLVAKTYIAAKEYKAYSVLLSGGVAANNRLRQKFIDSLEIRNLKLEIFFPPPSLCTDNAAAIAAYAYIHNHPKSWRMIQANPNLSVEQQFFANKT